MRDTNKYFLKLLTLMLLTLGVNGFSLGQTNSQEGPEVRVAVAPNYFPIALHSHTSGTVVVKVHINPDGRVISAEAVSGNPVLVGGTRSVARRWEFASTPDKNKIRSVELVFVYKLVPRDTPPDGLWLIFKPPYRVEITEALPDETPIPQTPMSKGKRRR
jgi:TonB family protein